MKPFISNILGPYHGGVLVFRDVPSPWKTPWPTFLRPQVWAVSLTEHQAMLDEILAAPQLLVLVSGNLAPSDATLGEREERDRVMGQSGSKWFWILKICRCIHICIYIYIFIYIYIYVICTSISLSLSLFLSLSISFFSTYLTNMHCILHFFRSQAVKHHFLVVAHCLIFPQGDVYRGNFYKGRAKGSAHFEECGVKLRSVEHNTGYPLLTLNLLKWYILLTFYFIIWQTNRHKLLQSSSWDGLDSHG